ncbi:MAG: hypothetical protein KDE25_10760 [Novosphingobium sp.]|nr:hypothetical protein [Novosphingobium sp.]
MSTKRVASGIIATVSVVVPTVIGMTWTNLDPTIGIPILSACGCLFIVAVALWLWPTPKFDPAVEAQRAYEIEQAKQRAISEADEIRKNKEIFGFLTGSAAGIVERIQRDREAEDEAARRKLIAAATRPPKPDWVPLHEALKYLVYESVWCWHQSLPADEASFDIVVGTEFLEALARGEIRGRGRLGWDNAVTAKRTTEAIPAQYWVTAFIKPHNEIVLADRELCASGVPNQDCYRAIVIDMNEVRENWPSSDHEGLSPLAQFCEPLRAEIELEERRQQKPPCAA